MKISHISFDLWGTLIESNPLYKGERNKLLNEIFDVHVNSSEVAANKLLVDRINSTTERTLTYSQTIAIILKEHTSALQRYDFCSKVRDFDGRNEELVFKYPPLLKEGVMRVLNSLSTRVAMSIASNTSFIRGSQLRGILLMKNLSAYISFQIYSDEVYMSKPYAGVFRMLCDRAKVPSNQIIHVGDDPFTDSGNGVVRGIIVKNISEILKEVNEKSDILLSQVYQ